MSNIAPEKPSLVIIGANAFQDRLITKAKEMGFQTHVFAWQSGDVGEQNADVFYPLSIVEKELILAECRTIQPAGVVSIASDLAVPTVNYVAAQLGLTHNTEESTSKGTNKYAMRKALALAGCPVPRFVQAKTVAGAEAEVEAAVEAAGEGTGLSYPLIVKPTDRSGSRGVTKVEQPGALRTALEAAFEQSLKGEAIVEEFLLGEEFSAEFISWQGEHHCVALTRKFTTGAPHFIETGQMQPSGLTRQQVALIQQAATQALNALGMKYGASHTELKLAEDGRVGIIEVGLRMGGDFIGSDLVPLSTDYDYLKAIIAVACGNPPELPLALSDNAVAPSLTEQGFARQDSTLQNGAPQSAALVRFIFNQADRSRVIAAAKHYPKALIEIDAPPISDTLEVRDSSMRQGYALFCLPDGQAAEALVGQLFD